MVAQEKKALERGTRRLWMRPSHSTTMQLRQQKRPIHPQQQKLPLRKRHAQMYLRQKKRRRRRQKKRRRRRQKKRRRRLQKGRRRSTISLENQAQKIALKDTKPYQKLTVKKLERH